MYYIAYSTAIRKENKRKQACFPATAQPNLLRNGLVTSPPPQEQQHQNQTQEASSCVSQSCTGLSTKNHPPTIPLSSASRLPPSSLHLQLITTDLHFPTEPSQPRPERGANVSERERLVASHLNPLKVDKQTSQFKPRYKTSKEIHSPKKELATHTPAITEQRGSRQLTTRTLADGGSYKSTSTSRLT